jgi:hypothetical protein
VWQDVHDARWLEQQLGCIFVAHAESRRADGSVVLTRHVIQEIAGLIPADGTTSS